MRPSTLVGLALLLGAITAYLAAQWVGLGAQSPSRPRVKLVVASMPIEAGTVIANTQIKQIDWFSAELPVSAIQDDKKAVGRVTRFPMQPGEPVLESKLAPVDAKAGLSAMIAEGKRAISVRVNEVIAVAGFTLPGSFVDVLVSGKDEAQQPFSRVVISRAKVLAIAQETNADTAKPKVVNAVTLELTPQETERLDLARTVGTLSLVLRNESDHAPLQSSGARLHDLMGSSGAKQNTLSQASEKSPSTEDAAANSHARNRASKDRMTEQSKKSRIVEEIRGTARMGDQP